MSVAIARHQFTVDDYHRMAESGILRDDSRVELIDGEIVDMAPIGRKHQSCVDRLARLTIRALDETEAVVRVRGSLQLNRQAEPQPDLVLLRPSPDFYGRRVAQSSDVLLVVEVSDTTFAYDRNVKIPMYARDAIPEAWIVDINGRRVLVFREPSAGEYRDVSEVVAGEKLSPIAFPGLIVDVDRLFRDL
jgi:Uma2 family endonuclease